MPLSVCTSVCPITCQPLVLEWASSSRHGCIALPLYCVWPLYMATGRVWSVGNDDGGIIRRRGCGGGDLMVVQTPSCVSSLSVCVSAPVGGALSHVLFSAYPSSTSPHVSHEVKVDGWLCYIGAAMRGKATSMNG